MQEYSPLPRHVMLGSIRCDRCPSIRRSSSWAGPAGAIASLKGLRRVDDGRLILSALPPADTIVRMAERPAYNFDLSKLAQLERNVLEKAGGGATIGSIVRDASLERSAALRACYALLTLGLLEIADAGEDVEQERAPEPVEAELVQEAAPEEEEEDAADGVARRNRIEQLERDAKLHLHVKEWDGAISLLHELVALAPANASYQLMLGQAMQFHPTLEKTAEEHFLQAVTLAPNDAHAHVALGRYYQRTKKHARAITELERALKIDPRNEDATRYLEKGHQPTRMTKLFKKIFGWIRQLKAENARRLPIQEGGMRRICRTTGIGAWR